MINVERNYDGSWRIIEKGIIIADRLDVALANKIFNILIMEELDELENKTLGNRCMNCTWFELEPREFGICKFDSVDGVLCNSRNCCEHHNQESEESNG